MEEGQEVPIAASIQCRPVAALARISVSIRRKSAFEQGVCHSESADRPSSLADGGGVGATVDNLTLQR